MRCRRGDVALTTLTNGALRGTFDDGIVVFRGIPYARPPVGPLRFASPQPPEGWTDVRYAVDFGPPAVQTANAVIGGWVN
jgi:para-nitrobenzyl esterase